MKLHGYGRHGITGLDLFDLLTKIKGWRMNRKIISLLLLFCLFMSCQKQKIIINKEYKISDILISRYNVDKFQARVYSEIIESFAEMMNLDKWFVVATICVESNFNLLAINKHKTCYGLMQINLKTGQELCDELELPYAGKYTLFDPYFNILIGCYYFSKLDSLCKIHKLFEDHLQNLTVAYNVGLGNYLKIKRGDFQLINYDHWNKIKKEHEWLIANMTEMVNAEGKNAETR